MPTTTHHDQSENIKRAGREQRLTLDAQIRVKGASKSFYAAFQVTPEETVGRRLADLGNGQWNVPALLTLLAELLEIDGEFDDFKIQHDFPTLGRRMMLVSARRLLACDSAGGGKILLSMRDDTEQKPSQAERGESPTRLRATLNSIGDAVIVTDLERRITFMNAAAETITGWAKSEAVQRPLADVFHNIREGSVKLGSSIAEGILAGEVNIRARQTVLIARDGTEWPIEKSSVPILDATDRIIGLVLVFHDIGNRRKAEQELKFSETRYRRLFEAAHDGVLILDAATLKVLDVNPFMGELLGFSRDYFLGKELWEIGVFNDAESSKEAMATLQKAGYIRYEDHPLRHKDGRHIPVEFVCNVYSEGDLDVIQCNIRDITERKHLTEALALAREATEAASHAKSEFLANMSHEIRTPMTAILGFAEMLTHKSAAECDEIGCVQIIRRNAAHLLELINEMLDLSKVEAGQMTVERIDCDLTALLSEIISVTRPRAAEKRLGFSITFQGPIPRLIQSDPLRLRQILINLLGNALKFTESGRIDMRIVEGAPKGPNIVLRIDVIDSGIGMPPELIERLFRPFAQGDESLTRKFGGTGLGLAISKQLANLLGGDITVSSQPHFGSTFTLTFDGGPSTGVERFNGLTEATLPGKIDRTRKAEIYLCGRILLVEDGADNQRLLRMQLSSAGGSVVIAENGQMAVDLATTQPFDLILMDMQMPVMDGHTATTELRRRGLTTPIIALTAYAMAEDREKCIAAGCNSYLAKPVAEATLLTAVSQYLGKLVPKDRTGGNAMSTPSACTPSGSDRLRSSLADDPRMLEIIPGFVERLSGKVSQMVDLLKHGDLVELHRVLHGLVGSAGGYGFATVSQAARKAQQSIRAGAALERIAAETNSLIEIIRQIEGYDESKAPATNEKSANKPVQHNRKLGRDQDLTQEVP
jgi:PAS domain S-box-containing protein